MAIERVELKDVEIPVSMQRAMAKEAEAAREKRARLIKAEAEQEASMLLSQAAQQMMENPAALELRRLQMLTEIGAENNTTTLVMIPSDIISLAKEWSTAAHNNNMAAMAHQSQPAPQIAHAPAPTEQLLPSPEQQLNLPAPAQTPTQQASLSDKLEQI